MSLLASLFAVALAAPPSVAVADLKTVNVSREEAAFAAEHVGQALSARGLRVVTQGDVAATLGLQRQKELLGCSDDSGACSAELASALGVDLLLTGTLARLGTRFQVNLKLVDATRAQARATWSGSTRDEGDLPEILEKGARALADALEAQAVVAAGGSLTAAAPASMGLRFWLPMGVGVALVAGGAACSAVAEGDYAALTGPRDSLPPLQEPQARALRDRGQTLQLLGPVLMGVGAASMAAAVVLRATATGPSLSAGLIPGGGAVTLRGQF